MEEFLLKSSSKSGMKNDFLTSLLRTRVTGHFGNRPFFRVSCRPGDGGQALTSLRALYICGFAPGYVLGQPESSEAQQGVLPPRPPLEPDKGP